MNESRRWDTNEGGGILSRLTLNVGVEGPAEALNKHGALITSAGTNYLDVLADQHQQEVQK